MNNPASIRAYVCCGPDCTARRSPALLDLLEREVAAAGLSTDVEVMPSGCMKHCERGPSMVIRPGLVYYERVDPARLRRIVRQHLRDGRPIPEWFYQGPDSELAPPPAPRVPSYQPAPVTPRPVPAPSRSAQPGRPPPLAGKKPHRPAPEVDDFKW